MGLAERGVGVNEFTAGHWVFTDEITITETDDDDHAGAEDETEGGPDRAGIWQKLVARHDEAAPTDHGADGEPPDAERAELFLKLNVLLLL